MTTLERRYTAGRVEIRLDKGRTFGGYAAKFNRQSKNLGGFIEVIDPGFFNKSQGDGWPDVMARYNHEDLYLLGTTAARTLRLSVDGTGLLYEVDPPKAREDVVELVQRGDVQKSSFAFRAFEDDWALSDQGFPQRTLLSGQLVDVAPVNQPAYDDTSVAMSRAMPALESLAVRFSAPLEEVRNLAESNDLGRFFKRTDAQPAAERKLSAAAALALVKGIRVS